MAVRKMEYWLSLRAGQEQGTQYCKICKCMLNVEVHQEHRPRLQAHKRKIKFERQMMGP